MSRELGYSHLVLIAAAVLPAVILLIYVYKKDKLEKESRKILLQLIALGFAAAVAAVLTETMGTMLLAVAASSEVFFNVMMNFVVIALSEEGFKYLFLKVRTWKSEEFNCQFDGVVYAAFVSLGFALLENIMFVIGYGLETALLRAVTAIPGHACFGIFMGVFYGLAKRSQKEEPEKTKRFLFMALLIPTLLHGTYDYIATNGSDSSIGIFIVFVGIMFVISWILIRKMSREDQYL